MIAEGRKRLNQLQQSVVGMDYFNLGKEGWGMQQLFLRRFWTMLLGLMGKNFIEIGAREHEEKNQFYLLLIQDKEMKLTKPPTHQSSV